MAAIGSAVDLDADRRHAVGELAIRGLKHGAGLRHYPSGRFLANAAWLVLGALAHNLLRWVATTGLGSADPVVAKTLGRRVLHLAQSLQPAVVSSPQRHPNPGGGTRCPTQVGSKARTRLTTAHHGPEPGTSVDSG
jgi:hypothetical protein